MITETIADNQQIKHKNVVVLGPTGSGKSTLLNLLIGKKLKKNPKGCGLLCEDEYFKSSSALESETKEFKQYIMKDTNSNTNITYIDTPGLLDTNLIDRAYNLLKIHNLITKTNCVIAFVLEISNAVSIKGDAFIKSLQFFKQIYNDLSQCSESAFFVITKYFDAVDEIDQILQGVIDRIQKMASEEDDKQLKGLPEFISQIKEICTFSRPAKNQITELELHQNEKERILQSINTLKEMPHANNFLENFKLDSDTYHTISIELPQKFRELKDPIDEMIVKQLTQNIIIKNTANLSYEEKIKYFEEQDNFPFEEKMEQYNTFLSQLGSSIDDEMKSKLMFHYERLNTFSVLLKDDVKMATFKIKGLERMHSAIKVDRNHFNRLSLSGYFLQSSVLKEFVDQYKVQTSEVEIKVDYFIVDKDLECKGISLIIQCKQFIIDQNSHFNLSGENGKNIEPIKATGEDGQPGNPGNASGHFILITDKLTANKCNILLSVDISGGSGGNGQEGGDGEEGKTGEDGDLEGVQQKKTQYIIEHQEVTSTLKNLTSYNRQFRIRYQSKGTQGSQGTDAFKGGSGGLQGESGKVIIKLTNNNSVNYDLIKVIDGNAKIGQNGNHGRPGLGGLQGKTAFAVYEDEYIFPLVRSFWNKLMKKYKSNQNEIDEGHVGNFVAMGSTLSITGGALSTTGTALTTASKSVVISETGKEVGKEAMKEVVKKVGIEVSGRALAFGLGVGLTVVQVGGSIISANWKNKFIENPKFKNSTQRGQSGKIPTEHNIQGLCEPKVNLLSICFEETEICKLINENNLFSEQIQHKCQLK